jgi:hypothetical protein
MPERCEHCDPAHGSPNRCRWGVHVDTERDGDGQPTRLIVQPTDGSHVAQSDADWLWDLIRTRGNESGPVASRRILTAKRARMAQAGVEGRE